MSILWEKGNGCYGYLPHLLDTKFIFWFSLRFKIELEKITASSEKVPNHSKITTIISNLILAAESFSPSNTTENQSDKSSPANMVRVAQLHEYNKSYWIIHFGWVLCELYLNKVVFLRTYAGNEAEARALGSLTGPPTPPAPHRRHSPYHHTQGPTGEFENHSFKGPVRSSTTGQHRLKDWWKYTVPHKWACMSSIQQPC